MLKSKIARLFVGILISCICGGLVGLLVPEFLAFPVMILVMMVVFPYLLPWMLDPTLPRLPHLVFFRPSMYKIVYKHYKERKNVH
jgi:hypothetical protein